MNETPLLFGDAWSAEAAQQDASSAYLPAGSLNSQPADRALPADHDQRMQAIDVSQNVLVQAPAGSGKTDLLTRRYLALLAEGRFENPDQILAITFTRAATAEMRTRILDDLRLAADYEASLDAGDPRQPEASIDPARLALARRALARARERGWPILDQPALLQIESIDSLAMRIAHGQPLLARLGGQLTPSEDADALYKEAARRTIRNLGGSNSMLDEALTHLLRRRDVNLSDCEDLLAQMLSVREGWEEYFPLAGEVDWEDLRFALEQPFRNVTHSILKTAKDLLAAEGCIGPELLSLAQFALSNQMDSPLAPLATLTEIEQLSSIDHWKSLCSLLLTKDRKWRKKEGVNIKLGFPSSKEHAPAKVRMKEMLERLNGKPGLHRVLCQIDELPPAAYDDDEWQTLQHLFLALRRALGELRVLFAEKNQVDFLEITRAALIVLEEREHGMRWSEQLQHLLVDEFQDTSRRHQRLIEALLESWQPGQERSYFLVGDPMQSIYLFRQAEVEIFERTREKGLREGFPLHPLDLKVNFRSHAQLTEPLNQMLRPIFEAPSKAQGKRIEFSPSVAAEPTALTAFDPPLQLHAQFAEASTAQSEKRRLQEQEAKTIVEIIEQHAAAMEQASERGKEYRIAILVRNKSHLAHILPMLRKHGIAYRAVEIDSLDKRQELRDILALARAILHPMDRIAWLSLLRAPWCGLNLEELHILTGADDLEARRQAMPELIEQNLSSLGAESAQRVSHLLYVMQQANKARMAARANDGQANQTLSSWIERAWRDLGGPLCLNSVEAENVEVLFTLLDELKPDGAELLGDEFEEKLKRLFAQPDPTVSERVGVQVMTIHKAKGLGFEVVIVPALERGSGKDDSPLITSLQKLNPETGDEEFFIAPIGTKGNEQQPLYQWVQRQKRYRYEEERKRLFYVATTRARRELHLIGTITYNDKKLSAPTHGSLLATAWPALEEVFEQKFTSFLHEKVEAPQTGALSTPERTNLIGLPIRPSNAELPGELHELAASAARSSIRRLSNSMFSTLATHAMQRTDLSSTPSATKVAEQASLELAASLEESEDMGKAQSADQPSALRKAQSAGDRIVGSRLSRAIGSVLHEMLERVGEKLVHQETNATQLQRQIHLLLGQYGLPSQVALKAQNSILTMLERCATHSEARWILGKQAGAQSESSWSAIDRDGTLRTRRADRIFYSGATPLSSGQDHLWILDYKTSTPSAEESQEDFLQREHAQYQSQLEAYAHLLRGALGEQIKIRLGLYYPQILYLDWWPF